MLLDLMLLDLMELDLMELDLMELDLMELDLMELVDGMMKGQPTPGSPMDPNGQEMALGQVVPEQLERVSMALEPDHREGMLVPDHQHTFALVVPALASLPLTWSTLGHSMHPRIQGWKIYSSLIHQPN